MTNAEIQAWGKTVSIVQSYVAVEELELFLRLNAADIGQVSAKPQLMNGKERVSPTTFFLHMASAVGDGQFVKDKTSELRRRMATPGLTADRAPVSEVGIRLKGRLRIDTVDVVGVWNYRGIEPGSHSEALVSRYGTGSTEVIQRENNASVMLDVSGIRHPENCLPLSQMMDFGRIVTAKIIPVGKPSLGQISVNPAIRLIV